MSETYVLILSWNQREQTLRCLESLRQCSGPQVRLVLIDNGSSDGTAETVRSRFPQVELVALAANQGYCAGFNHGLRLALERHAGAAVLLNNDAELDRKALIELQAASGPEPAILGPKIFFRSHPDRLQSAGAKVVRCTGRVRHLGYRQLDLGQYDAPTRRDALSGCCLWINQAALQRVGLLDEDYFAYFEDVEYCLRARGLGARVELVPRARVWHEGSASLGGESSPLRLYYSVRNHLRVLDQRLPLSRWGATARRSCVLGLSLAYLIGSSRIPKTAGCRALLRGWRDYCHGVQGPLKAPLA